MEVRYLEPCLVCACQFTVFMEIVGFHGITVGAQRIWVSSLTDGGRGNGVMTEQPS